MGKNSTKYKTPFIAKFLFKIFSKHKTTSNILGDIEEIFYYKAESEGYIKASLWYILQVIVSIPHFIFLTLHWNIIMLTNYLKISLRNLYKYKSYTLINLFGLAVGIASCILMFLFVNHEISYDRYHKNYKNIYRFVREVEGFKTVPTAFALTPALRSDFPEIKTARFYRDRSPVLMKYEDNKFYEKNMFWADQTALEIFSFPQISGDPKTALRDPYSAVITESTALKYFGNINAVGKNLLFSWGEKEVHLLVTGVLKDIPSNSHFKFDILLSFSTAEAIWPKEILENWNFNFAYTYILLPSNLSASGFEKQFKEFVKKHVTLEKESNYKKIIAELQPLEDIHLYSNIGGEIEVNGNIKNIYAASVLGILILIVACINYMNLATAKSSKRAKEIGIRKVSGACKSQIINQFLGEALLLSVLSLTAAFIITAYSLPYFNEIVNRELIFNPFDDKILLWGSLAICFFAGLLSGSYPAFFLSSIIPALVIKGKTNNTSSKGKLRKLLVVIQFTISIILLIGTIVIYKQIDYAKNKKLGFNKEQILIIPQGRLIRDNAKLITDEFKNIPGLINASVTSHIPADGLSVTGYSRPEGGNPNGSADPWPISVVSVDYNFFSAYNIQLLKGRVFSNETGYDKNESIILNEAAVKALKWENPVGKSFELSFNTGNSEMPVETRKANIIGVVKDFHFESLHSKIQPVAFIIKPYWYFYISLKLKPDNISETVASIETKWKNLVPDYPIEYSFLDDHFNKLYKSEEEWAKGLTVFAAIAIVVACLGLLGLISYTAEKRTKEIGIRKVLGADNSSIIIMLSKEFFALVVISNLVAWPVSYYIFNNWLKDYSYRIEIGLWIFLAAGCFTLLLAFTTIFYQALKAASAKPAQTLRTE